MAVAVLAACSFAGADHRTEGDRPTACQSRSDGANTLQRRSRPLSGGHTAKVIETLRGCWDELVYTLPLGVDTNSAIKLELGYLGGMVRREFIFKVVEIVTGPSFWIAVAESWVLCRR